MAQGYFIVPWNQDKNIILSHKKVSQNNLCWIYVCIVDDLFYFALITTGLWMKQHLNAKVLF